MRYLSKKVFPILLATLLVLAFGMPLNLAKTKASTSGGDWEEIPVVNGDFESPSTNGSIPGWAYWSGGYKTGLSVSADKAYSGTQSLRVDNVGSTGLYSQVIKVQPGDTYKISAYMYLESIQGKPGIWFRWYDKSGALIKSDPKYFDNAPTDQWQHVDLQATAPAQADSVRVFIYETTSTFMKGYYDNIQFFHQKPKPQLELPFKYGAPIDLGPATLAAQTPRAAISNTDIFFVTNGTTARFNDVDIKTGEVKFSQDVPGNDVVWAMTIGSDGNVYFSGTYNRILYRYSPDQKKIESVGANPSDDWVWDLDASKDGKIYGATYPHSKIFEYDINTNTFKDLGPLNDSQKYARGLGVSDDYVYGGTGSTAYLYKIDRNTGVKSEIKVPATGQQTMISNIWDYNHRLFVAYGTSLSILNKDTEEVLKDMNWQDPNTFDGRISPPSPYDSNLIYFRNKNTSELWTYNIATNTTQPVEPRVELPDIGTVGMNWVTEDDGTKVLVIMNGQVQYSLYNPKTNSLDTVFPKVQLQGISVNSLEIGPDANVYMGGYQSSIAVYNPQEEKYTLQERQPAQIEGIGFFNDKVYMGAYGGARIYEFDPSKPYTYDAKGGAGDNPYQKYAVPDDQSRPFTFTSGDNKLFVGTIPDYGALGGSVAIYDGDKDSWKSIRNIIPNQSIIGLAYQDGKLFGGSSIYGGLGGNPTENQAKMFKYDVNTGQYHVFDLNVDGLKTPKLIGELSIGPDKKLWGAAWGYTDSGSTTYAIFEMDPKTLEIEKSLLMYPGVGSGSTWRPYYMRWDENGLLYTSVGRKLSVIDPKTMLTREIVSQTVNLFSLDPAGNVYYAIGSHLYKLPKIITIDDVSKLVTKYEDNGSLDHSTAQQLTNNIAQALHHHDIGNTDQAIKHLQDFIKHLDNSDASQEIKLRLHLDINVVIKDWQK